MTKAKHLLGMNARNLVYIKNLNPKRLKDIVDDKKTGLLIEPGNKKQLKEAIELLIRNPKLRQKLGEEGRKIVKKKFDGDKIAKEMIRIYKYVLGI